MAVATCVATAFEQRRPLPVDALIPDPLFTSTHAITIDAPPEEVWPWIAQMGAGRAGWYSWDAIDNGRTPSAMHIVPEFQTVVPGGVMPAVPHATDAFVVASVDPPRDLVLTVPDGRGGHAVAWEHVLDPLEGGRTRLIARGRASSRWLDLARAPSNRRRIFIERAYAALATLPRPLLIAFAAWGHRIMEARHLRGIQRRSTAGKRFRLYSIASIVVLLASGTLTFLEAPRLQANLPTPWIGLWERINISVFLLWVVVLAAAVLRTGTSQEMNAEALTKQRSIRADSRGNRIDG